MFSFANGITFARIVLALVLIFVKPLSVTFFLIYFICGISDVLDGYVARKTNTVSRLGRKLDSVADLIMALVVIYLLYPYVRSILQMKIIIWIVVIGIVRLLSVFIVYLKYKKFEILHTYGNKATGLLLFLFPFLLPWDQLTMFVYLACGVASLSAIEELLIHLSSRELQTDKKNIFMD